jgi:hypothetical protein
MNSVAPNDLTQLAEVARAEHLAVGEAAKNVVEHALKCGAALNTAKSKLDAGTWLTWLSSTEIKERTAQRYMKLAANREKLEAAIAERSDTMSGVTFNGAMALITKRKVGTGKGKSGGVQQQIDQLVETIRQLASPKKRIEVAENVVAALRDMQWIQ